MTSDFTDREILSIRHGVLLIRPAQIEGKLEEAQNEAILEFLSKEMPPELESSATSKRLLAKFRNVRGGFIRANNTYYLLNTTKIMSAISVLYGQIIYFLGQHIPDDLQDKKYYAVEWIKKPEILIDSRIYDRIWIECEFCLYETDKQ